MVVVTEPAVSNGISECKDNELVAGGRWVVSRSELQSRTHYCTLTVSRKKDVVCPQCRVLWDYSLSYLLFKMRGKEQHKEITNTVITEL